MENDISLKKCPCCGAIADFTYAFVSNATTRHEQQWVVYCSKCGLRTKTYKMKEKAAAAWNRRANNDIS